MIRAFAKCLACFAALSVSSARADFLLNTDIQNTTGQTANDYHIEFEALQQFEVTTVYASRAHNGQPGARFPSHSVTGNGTTNVTITWSGATIFPGNWTHVGAATPVGTGTPNGLQVEDSFWTINGKEIDPGNPTGRRSGLLPSFQFTGNSGSGPWLVARVTLYDNPNGMVIGHAWAEGRGTGVTISNQTTEVPIFETTAFLTPVGKVPLASLNETLGGFGPDGPLTTLNPMGDGHILGDGLRLPDVPTAVVPEPGTALLFSLGGGMLVWGFYRRRSNCPLVSPVFQGSSFLQAPQAT
jgi:hypothetical protein